MYANEGVNMLIKHKTKSQNIFLLFAKQNNMHKHKYYSPLSKENKYFSPLSKENMHIYLKYFSTFLSIINKGVKVKTKSSNFSPPFLSET